MQYDTVLLTGAYFTTKLPTKSRTFFFSFLSVRQSFLFKNENILKIIAVLFGRCKYMPYIYNIIITQKDTAMKIELTEKLRSAKGQLNYVNETLNSGFDFEAWEKKEYEDVKAGLIEEIESLEYRLTLV